MIFIQICFWSLLGLISIYDYYSCRRSWVEQSKIHKQLNKTKWFLYPQYRSKFGLNNTNGGGISLWPFGFIVAIGASMAYLF
jgi:hypothetical protein